MERTCNVVLITGPPGIGKTTLIKKICDELAKTYVCHGFFTEEVRSAQRSARIGFDVVTLLGHRTTLARENPGTNSNRLPKVGKYLVTVKEFEDLVLPLLHNIPDKPSNELLVIDEIGKMELKSKKFEAAVCQKINNIPILATIPYQPRERMQLVEQLKNLPSGKVFAITKTNRDKIQNEIIAYIENILKNN